MSHPSPTEIMATVCAVYGRTLEIEAYIHKAGGFWQPWDKDCPPPCFFKVRTKNGSAWSMKAGWEAVETVPVHQGTLYG
jgi:hypothetical protein